MGDTSNRRPKYRATRALQSPLGTWLNERLYRWGLFHRVTGWLVWRDVRQDAEFMESIERGKADHAAGRFYYGLTDDTAPMRPSETWSPDDPIQPVGWHHDGKGWVLNDDGGWSPWVGGLWRYTKPGDVGWQEQPDGTWKYFEERIEV